MYIFKVMLLMHLNASYQFLLIRFKAHAVYQIQAAAVYIWAVETQDCCSQKPGRTEHLKTSNKTKISSVLPSLGYHSHDSEWKAAKKMADAEIYIKSRTSFIAQVFYLNRLWFDCAEWITWPPHHLCTEESLNHNDGVWAGRIRLWETVMSFQSFLYLTKMFCDWWHLTVQSA